MEFSEQSILIDGELTPAEGGRVYDNINPATAAVAGTAPDASAADLDRAVAAARRAFDDGVWADDVALRIHCLRQLQEELGKDVETVRAAHTVETGMPVGVAYAMGVDAPIGALGYWPELLGSYAFERELPDTTEFRGVVSRRVVRREPAGVVAAITPWNYPFQLNLTKVAHALAAGCTAVLKAAPDTPWSATLLGAAAARTDLPPGVLNVVTTSDNAVAEILTTHPDVDQVTFTGSTATGRLVMRNAAETIKRVSLELGGKSAAIICDDADLATAVAAAAGVVCLHAGQGCVLMTRVLVPQHLMAAATEIATAVMAAIPYGDPQDMANVMGPLISARQLERVLGYCELGRQEARCVAGGRAATHLGPGYWVEPTVFADVPPGARIAREEIFGPVVSLIGYRDDDDAVRIANDSPYGLSGAVYSADPERALRIARALRTGSVAINGANFAAPDTAFGGYKQSGLGREFGVEGLEEFLEAKALGIPV